MPTEGVKKSVRRCLTKYYMKQPCRNWSIIVEVICLLLDAVLTAQIVSYGSAGAKSLYLQIASITTGLSCGTQLAICYLHTLDQLVANSLGSHLWLYRRFIDDILIIADVPIEVLLGLLHCLDDGIVVTHDSAENPDNISFLDLLIHRSENGFYVSTYRKPACTYQYTPFNSEHALSSRVGIISTEIVRLLRTNSKYEDFQIQLEFFTGKLKQRGYCPTIVQNIAAKYPWSEKTNILERSRSRSQHVLVPFKLVYSSAAPCLNISAILHDKTKWLCPKLRDAFKVVTCFKTSPNLFRLRYNRFMWVFEASEFWRVVVWLLRK